MAFIYLIGPSMSPVVGLVHDLFGTNILRGSGRRNWRGDVGRSGLGSMRKLVGQRGETLRTKLRVTGYRTRTIENSFPAAWALT